jgi:hypothetical protein
VCPVVGHTNNHSAFLSNYHPLLDRVVPSVFASGAPDLSYCCCPLNEAVPHHGSPQKAKMGQPPAHADRWRGAGRRRGAANQPTDDCPGTGCCPDGCPAADRGACCLEFVEYRRDHLLFSCFARARGAGSREWARPLLLLLWCLLPVAKPTPPSFLLLLLLLLLPHTTNRRPASTQLRQHRQQRSRSRLQLHRWWRACRPHLPREGPAAAVRQQQVC